MTGEESSGVPNSGRLGEGREEVTAEGNPEAAASARHGEQVTITSAVGDCHGQNRPPLAGSWTD